MILFFQPLIVTSLIFPPKLKVFKQNSYFLNPILTWLLKLISVSTITVAMCCELRPTPPLEVDSCHQNIFVITIDAMFCRLLHHLSLISAMETICNFSTNDNYFQLYAMILPLSIPIYSLIEKKSIAMLRKKSYTNCMNLTMDG